MGAACSAVCNCTDYSNLNFGQRLIFFLLRPKDSLLQDPELVKSLPSTEHMIPNEIRVTSNFVTVPISSDERNSNDITMDFHGSLSFALMCNFVKVNQAQGTSKETTLHPALKDLAKKTEFYLTEAFKRTTDPLSCLFKEPSSTIMDAHYAFPSTFAMIFQHPQDFSLEFLKKVLEYVKDFPLLPKAYIRKYEGAVEAKNNKKTAHYRNFSFEKWPLFRALDHDCLSSIQRASPSYVAPRTLATTDDDKDTSSSSFSSLFDLMIDYSFDIEVFSEISTGNILHYIAAAYSRFSSQISHLAPSSPLVQQKAKESLKSIILEILQSLISSGKITQRMLRAKEGSGHHTPFVLAVVMNEVPEIVNEMIASKLYTQDDFDKSLYFLARHKEYLPEITTAVLSMPVENKIEKAKAIVGPIRDQIRTLGLLRHFSSIF